MIVETCYRCEFCQSTYETAAEAEACENSHHTAEEIIAAEYLKSSPYPAFITVACDDGALCRYNFNRKTGEREIAEELSEG